MADDIQFGVVVTARQDSEAKNMMTASIEKLTGSISAKVGVHLVNSYKGQTIEQQLSNILKKAEDKSVKVSTRIVGTYKEKDISQQISSVLSKHKNHSVTVGVSINDKSAAKIRTSLETMLKRKNFNPLVTVGLDKGASKILIKQQLSQIMESVSTDQNLKVRMSGATVSNNNASSNSTTSQAQKEAQRAAAAAAQDKAAKTQAVAANNELITSYNNLMNIEQAVINHTQALGVENVQLKSKVYNAANQLKTFAAEVTNADGSITRINYKLNQSKTGYDVVTYSTREATQAVRDYSSAQELLNQRFNQWVAANPKLSASQSNMVAQTRSLVSQAGQSEEALDRATLALRRLEETSKSKISLNMSMGKISTEITRIFARMGSSLVVTQLYTSIYKIFDAIRDVDSAMVSLKKVTDETARTYDNFLTKTTDNATKLGIAVSDLVEQTATWAKLGYTLEQASKLSQVSAIYSNVGEVDNETAVKDIVTALKAYNINSSDAITVVNELNKLSNEFAVDAAGLGDGLKRAASTMSFTGNTMEQTLALLTGGGEITQDLASLGNALKIVSLRLQNQAGKLQEIGEDYEDIESVSKVQTQIYNLTHGKVNIMQDNDPNSFKSTYEILEQIAEVIEELNDTEASELVQLMFGKSRANQGMAILQAFQSGQVQKAFEAANNAENSAINEHEKWLNSLDAKIAQLKAAGQSFSLEFLDTKLVKDATDSLTSLLNTITKIMSSIGSLPVILTGIVTSLAAIKNAGIFGVVDGDAKGFANKFGILGESFRTIGNNYRTNVMNTTGSFRAVKAFGGTIADTFFRSGISEEDSTALRMYAANIMNADDKQKVFNSTMANASKIAQKQVAVIDNLNTQRKAGIISEAEYAARVYMTTQAIEKQSFAQRVLNAAAKAGVAIANTVINMGITFLISSLVSLVFKLANSAKETAEKLKDVGQAARETTKSISELHSEYLNLNIAVENGTASKEDLTSKTNELLTALGYEGIAVSELIEKYGSLDDAINQLSYDSLQEAHGGLVASVDKYKEDLLKTAKGSWGKNNFRVSGYYDTEGNFENAKYTEEEYNKLLSVLNKIDGLNKAIVTSGSYLGEKSIGNIFELAGDTTTVEGIKQNYETLLEIQKELTLAFGSERAGKFGIYTDVSKRLDEIKESYENYVNEVEALNKNAAQQSIISSLMGKELPKTQEEYDRFYNTLIAKATEANSEMRMQFIGSDEEIVDMIDAALRNMTVFKDFIVEDIPVDVSILPTVTVKVDALKSKLDEAKEKITEAIKNATLFDTAANTVNAETPISFDDVLTLVNLDGTLADKFTKTADGYTIAAEELAAAKERYIQSTEDSLNESIKVAKETVSEAESNIADMEARIREIKSDNYSVNSPYDYQKSQDEIADLADTIEIERQNIDKANGVISENKLLLGELSDKLSKDLAPSLKNVENHVNLTKSAMEDMRDSGQISASTYDSIISAGKNYSECLEIQNGKLVVNIQKLKELQQQELKNEIAEVRFAKASWETVMATKSMAGEDTSAIAKKIRELNLQEAALNTAIDEIGNAKPEDNKNKEEPAQVTKFKKELAEKQHLVAMKELSEEDYLNWLDGAYKEAYAGLTGYEEDLYKYEEEIFSKRKELAEKAFDDTIDGIEKEIDALEKLKDEASIDADKIIDPKATEELKKFNEEMQKTFGLGNVDLTKRPKVDAETMRKAGYEAEDGETATVYSSTEFIWQGDDKNGKYVAVHYTPILPDGTVLDDESLRKYLYETLESSQDILDTDKNNLGIVLKVDTDFNISENDIQSLETDKPTQNIQDIIKACDDWDIALHEVQEQWMELDDKVANSNVNNGDNIYEIIDKQIGLYNNAIAEIDKRIAELEASGLVGIEDEIKELNTKREELLDKVYNLSKERTSIGVDNEIKYWEEMQTKQNEFYDKQIERLKEQKKLLEDKNDEEERAKDLAEKQLELRKAQIALGDARRNRNVLVYTAGGGYSYEADQTAIAEAEDDVKKAKEDLAKTEKDILKDGIDKQIDILEEQKDKDSEYYDTIIKLLEDMSGKNKVQSESNRSIWGELLATDAGQKALAQIDPDKLQELLDSGFLVQKDGKYSLGETAAIPSTMSVADVVALVDKTIAETSVNNSSVGYDQTSLNVQAAANERSSAIKNSVFNNSNVSQISISQVDVKYAGESVDNFAAALMGAVGNRVTTLTNQKVSNAT